MIRYRMRYLITYLGVGIVLAHMRELAVVNLQRLPGVGVTRQHATGLALLLVLVEVVMCVL